MSSAVSPLKALPPLQLQLFLTLEENEQPVMPSHFTVTRISSEEFVPLPGRESPISGWIKVFVSLPP